VKVTSQALPFILFQGFLFGTTLIASRFSVGQFSPTTYIGLRMSLASLGHIFIYALLSRRKLPRDLGLWLRAGLLGIIGTAVPMTAIVTSLQYQSSGVTSMLITAGPAITVVLAHFTLFDEQLSTRKGLGVILALGGAVLLAVLGESGLPDVRQVSPTGYVLVLVAMTCAGAMTIYARKYMQAYDSFDVASVRMFAATLAVMPLSLILVGFDLSQVDGRGYVALGYATVAGTFSGMFMGFYIIKRFGATTSAMTGYIIPVVAGIGGALVLGESVTLGMLAAMALIGGGITLLNQRVQIGSNVAS
jgi:drug/metabolite transporter (DMT)-like permease